MIQLEHFKPKSIDEAVSLLSKYGEKSKVIAGGTDLLGQIKKRVTLPASIIDIGGISALDYINYNDTTGQ